MFRTNSTRGQGEGGFSLGTSVSPGQNQEDPPTVGSIKELHHLTSSAKKNVQKIADNLFVPSRWLNMKRHWDLWTARDPERLHDLIIKNKTILGLIQLLHP